eukprot:gene8799-7012_t
MGAVRDGARLTQLVGRLQRTMEGKDLAHMSQLLASQRLRDIGMQCAGPALRHPTVVKRFSVGVYITTETFQLLVVVDLEGDAVDWKKA